MKKESEKVDTSVVTNQSNLIWESIKDLDLDLFALPGQKIAQFCSPVEVEPSKLYLKIKVSSVLPALEMALSKKFAVERTERFVVVSRIVDAV